MVLKSYAKINLTLLVNKRKNNVVHEIQSLFCMINLHDNISIRKINEKKDSIHFTGPYSKSVSKSKNSVQKLLNYLRKKKLISDYYLVKINKKIPVFSGLAGGTSNAATVLKFFKKKTKTNIVDELTGIIGTDLRLFFHTQGYLKNLKEVTRFKRKFKLYLLIAYPKIKCSTKFIYSKVKIYSPKRQLPKQNLNLKRQFIKYLVNSKNDLQFIVEKKYPIIRNLLKSIKGEKGCYLSRLTGSGSVCYGLFNNENCSKVALIRLRKKYPKFWFSIAKTI